MTLVGAEVLRELWAMRDDLHAAAEVERRSGRSTPDEIAGMDAELALLDAELAAFVAPAGLPLL